MEFFRKHKLLGRIIIAIVTIALIVTSFLPFVILLQ